MSKRTRTKLVPPSTKPEKQSLVIEESNQPEQKEDPVITELDNEIECPRCNDTLVLCSSFDKLVYSCECCHFSLECV